MQSRNDNELLQGYCEDGDEAAFAQIVERHLALVYSVALRVTVDPHLAEDATQATFAALAKEASQLVARPVLTSWLHRTAFNQAANIVRSETRRRARELEAVTMQSNQPDDNGRWGEIAPLLDAALDKLADADRCLLLLRYFEKKTGREIAAALNLSEPAAHKRVNRALLRLRRLLAPANVSAAGLAALLSAEAIVTAPVALSATVAAVAIGNSAAGAAGVTTLQTMAMSKLKIAVVSAFFCAGVAGPIILQHQALKQLRQTNHSLQAQLHQAEAIRTEKEALSRQLADARAKESASKTQLSELQRLRGEVGLLRRESQELARLRSASPAGGASGPPEPDSYIPSTAWANVGAEKPESAIQTFFWAAKQGDTNVFSGLLRWRRDPAIPDSKALDDQFTASLVAGSANFAGEVRGFRITSVDLRGEGEDASLGIEVTNDIGKTEPHLLRLVKEDNQWFPVMNIWEENPGSIRASLDVPPKLREAN